MTKTELEVSGYAQGTTLTTKVSAKVSARRWAAGVWAEHKTSLLTGVGGVSAVGATVAWFW